MDINEVAKQCAEGKAVNTMTAAIQQAYFELK